MTTRNHHEEPIDRQRFKEVRRMREDGGITDDDRIVFFDPDEPVRLYSPFGHAADAHTFNGIAAANFRAMNPGLAGR